MKALYVALFLLLVSALTSLSSSSSCGGLLESDGGEFTLPRSERPSAGKLCVWIVKLLSRQSVRFILQELGNELTVSLYREHDPSYISLQPIRLNNTHVGRTVDTEGQTLVVVLSSSSNSNVEDVFSFKWDSLSAARPELISAANYVDKEAGEVMWNRFSNHEILTLSLNANKENYLDINVTGQIRECDLGNDCACSYLGLFELRSDGYLREVSVVCGRPSRVQAEYLYANVLAFVYLNSSYSVGSTDYVQVKWELSDVPPPRTTTTERYEPPETTADYDFTSPPSDGFSECGGIFNVSQSTVVMEYVPEGGYVNNQFCVWTLFSTYQHSTQIVVKIESHGIEGTYDGVTLYFWNEDGVVQSRKVLQGEYGYWIILEARYAALAFSSDGSNTGNGFRAYMYSSGGSYSPLTNYAFHLDEIQGGFSYPSDVGRDYYDNNERVTIVFQPDNGTTLENWSVSIDFLNLDNYADILQVYVLGKYYDSNQLVYVGSATGYHSGGIPGLTTYSADPRLFLFSSSNDGATAAGFSLSWRN